MIGLHRPFRFRRECRVSSLQSLPSLRQNVRPISQIFLGEKRQPVPEEKGCTHTRTFTQPPTECAVISLMDAARRTTRFQHGPCSPNYPSYLQNLSLIHISEPTRRTPISYA